MALAVLRGCKFDKRRQGDIVEYVPKGYVAMIKNGTSAMGKMFEDALDDVAQSIGYADRSVYNKGCANDPTEVRFRIRAL